MKTRFTVLFLLIGMTSIFAQSEEAMKKGAEQAYTATYNMDFEAILDSTYPKIFDFTPREQMAKILDATFQNDEFRIRHVFPTVKMNFTDIKEIEGKKVVVATYEGAMRMIFETNLSDEDVRVLQANLEATLAGKKVIYEANRNGFLISGPETMIAVSDELTKGEWKYINYDKSQRVMVARMLGENVLRGLGL